MDCPRCENTQAMFRTQMLDIEHIGNIVIRTCITVNECPQCGVIIKVIIPQSILVKEK